MIKIYKKAKVKKILRLFGKLLVFIITFIIFYLATAFLLSRITIKEELNAPDEVTIYILSNGVHTDIVMPTITEQMDWSNEINYANTISADSSYQFIALGWGDKRFYMETPTWAELEFSTAIKGATGFNSTAIHATYHREMVENEKCRKIMVSKEQYTRLVNFISNSFRKDKNGHFINIETDAHYGNSDAFYEAHGRTSLFNTCNSWANRSLKASGQRACFWTAFNDGIFLKYE